MKRVTKFYSKALGWIVVFKDSSSGLHWRPKESKTEWEGPFYSIHGCLVDASRRGGLSTFNAKWRREDRL